MADFSDAMTQIGQVLGTIGGTVLNAINTVGALEHGALPQMLANQAALQQDPAFRAQVNQPGFLSALRGSMSGMGMPSYAPDPNVQSAGWGNQGQLLGPTVNTALPPMTPQSQAEQAQAIRQAQMRTMTPEQAAEYAKQIGVGTPGGPTRLTMQTGLGTETFGGQTSGGGIGMDWPLVHHAGKVFAVDPATGRGHPLGAEPQPPQAIPPELAAFLHPGQAATPPTGLQPGQQPWDEKTGMPVEVPQPSPGAVKIPLDDAAMGRVRTAFDQMVQAGQMTPEERDYALQHARNEPDQTQPAPAPAGATPAPALPPGQVPVGDVKAKTWGDFLATQQPAEPQAGARVGYPSPAFLPAGQQPQAAPAQAQPASAAPPPPTAQPPAGPNLPPGASIRWNPKTGMSLSFSGPRTAPPKAVSAIMGREMANLASAGQAADAALAILKAGPQHPLEVMGTPVLNVPGLSGPVTGRGLRALKTVSGQPLAQETQTLMSLLDHTKTGVTALFGQRITKENKDFIRELLPDITQPPEILRIHLERLSSFYRMQVQIREALMNLSPEQRQAFTFNMFKQDMLGLTPPTGGSAAPATTTTTLPVIDGR